MGFRPSPEELEVLIDEIDEDGSGAIEFGEFAQLCAKFLVEVRERVGLGEMQTGRFYHTNKFCKI